MVKELTRRMKDSGVEWIGKIPEDWEVVKVKNLATGPNTLFMDGDWIESDNIEDEGIRYLTTGNIGSGYYKEQGTGYISENTFNKLGCLEVLPNDLVISRLNKPIGRACILPNHRDNFIIAVDNVVLRPNDEYEKKYLMYCMNTDRYNQEASNSANGATMLRISRTVLGNLLLPRPEIKKQKSIADFLDEKVLEIDNIIYKTKAVIEEYKKYKQSLIMETVTKGLDKNVEMKDSGIEWIGEIPKHWDAINMKYILSLRSGDSLTNSLLDNKSTYPVYGGGRRIGFFEKWNVTKENILIGRVGANCGCITELTSYAWATDNALVVRTNYNKKYIYYLLVSSNLNDLNESNAQPLITGTKVLNYKVPFISNGNEQKSIASYLDEKCTQIDNIISSKEKLQTEMESYKKSLIYETVTGKREIISI